jgi:Tfp pilus assembly protein PilX
MSATCLKPPSVKSQCGFLLVTAIFLLVILAALGAFILTISGTQQTSSALDVQGSRAYQAARAGIEWASDQLLISTSGTIAFRDKTPVSNGQSYGGPNITTFTINKPAAVVDNDVMLLVVYTEDATVVTPSVAGSWTLIDSIANGAVFRMHVYYRLAASEPASYAVTWGGTSIAAAGGMIVAYSGVITSGSPVDVYSKLANGFVTTNTATGVTPVGTTDMLVFLGTHSVSSATLTPPGGMTERNDTFALYAADQLLASNAATGNKTATLSVSSFNSAFLVALQPGPTPTTFATNCNAGSTAQNVTGMGGTLSGFTAAVTCSSTTYTEGSATWTVYQITSNGSKGAVGTLDRVERELQVTLIK